MTGSAAADRSFDELLAEALRVGLEKLGEPSDDPAALAAYVRGYYRHVALDDLLERDPVEIFGAALSHRALAQQRVEGELLIRVHSPTIRQDGWDSPHTVVEIVTDDMPFLVDSVAAELARQDIGLHLVVHPQFVVRREILGRLSEVLTDVDPESAGDLPESALMESWMHLEIDRQPAERLEAIANDLRRVLLDVREAVEDWRKMRSRALAVAQELNGQALPVPADDVREASDLLRWLADDHFTFLGYREYVLARDDAGEAIQAVSGSGLGILRSDSSGRHALSDMPARVRDKALEPSLLIVTKANSRSTVHRPVYLDYIGVKRFDGAGRVVGERRFLGLFSSAAYLDSVRHLPVVRRKVDEVMHRAGYSSRSHSGKDLLSILETYPRDELFQTSTDDLYDIVTGVMALQQRRQLRLFVRRDDYGRFWSCLVYLPRDRWNTRVRLRMQEILLSELHGTSVDYTTWISESVLARLHFVVRTPAGESPEPDVDAIQLRLTEATRTWDEDLARALEERVGEGHAPALVKRYGTAFPEAYKEDFAAATAVDDLRRLEVLDGPDEIAMSLYTPPDAHPDERRFKIYRIGASLSLAEVLPLFTAHGVRVVDERPYGLERGDGSQAWVYDFGLEHVSSQAAVERVSENFQNAFAAAWRGESEVDGFNALVLEAGLTWRQIIVLRAYAKYLRQIGSLYSQDYIQQAVRVNVVIAQRLVELFETRFDPEFRGDRAAREQELGEGIGRALDDVASLDQDRILRSLLGLITATCRTSYYQRGPDGRPKTYLALKFTPRAIVDLPRPRPQYEIFVYSPRVEGVHLRFGLVSRGGLRWSDRLEDFRTEVLGLAKAQMVKNSVIVPVGAKGGFVVKRPPVSPDRNEAAAALRAEGIACYRIFVSALLDLTDNMVGGAVVPAVDVVRHDEDDSYLVVAADKGTATFSDIANEISVEYGFWLGDAFASGGSVGYDHKAMGITARGAWESVKLHFRELGHDTQSEDFTVAGIGDMSGDVFGNGMLLSEHIRLVAAFDHRHVFVDPDPDAKASYAERRRLFELPRSSWGDYDPAVISAGGGVYPRTVKSIPLSDPVRRALGIDSSVTSLAPAELIRNILLAPVDLLWNGGIGTYVKATDESAADVGDKANDTVRVNGAELRCKVVGEGGNLGLTQRGRVEFSLAGGRINTDAIDNSAGVDTSDHEVNIKVLLDAAVERGAITREQRNDLLVQMTDEVAELVLVDNYSQNVALGNARAQAHPMLSVHRRLLADLERRGRLDRALEALPDEAELDARDSAGLGLTSPELCVLIAYVKIVLEDELKSSSRPDDEWFGKTLVDYFPTPLRARFREQMATHPLRRGIVTTQLVNDMVNRGGTTYVFRSVEETGVEPVDVASAYLVAREVFGLREYWAGVQALDTEVPTGTQVKLYLQSRRLLDRATRWLLQNRRHPLDIAAEIAHFRPGVMQAMPHIPRLLVADEADRLAVEAAEYTSEGVPEEVALATAGLLDAFSLLDVVEVAAGRDVQLQEVARVYFVLSEHFHFDDLLERISSLDRGDRWHSLARSALRYDLYAALSELTGEVLDSTSPDLDAFGRVTQWEKANASSLARAQNSLGELAEDTTYDLATLSVVLRQIRTMVRASASSAR
ncbi:MAG: NAD-glutamate dehydrogenase [Actinomycetota bacterium]|nr:NAD-glutamate dehydrogenase [Actinomycetota bacterium]